MDYKNISFDFKALAIIAVLCGMWYDLRTQFFVFKATTELRIDVLEKQQPKKLAQATYEAVTPEEVRRKNERKY